MEKETWSDESPLRPSGGMQSTSTCPYCPDSEIICDSHTGQKTCANCGAEVHGVDRFEAAEFTFQLEGERKNPVGR